jgi:hypothetical protein
MIGCISQEITTVRVASETARSEIDNVEYLVFAKQGKDVAYLESWNLSDGIPKNKLSMGIFRDCAIGPSPTIIFRSSTGKSETLTMLEEGSSVRIGSKNRGKTFRKEF